jgi:hypothetical protein
LAGVDDAHAHHRRSWRQPPVCLVVVVVVVEQSLENTYIGKEKGKVSKTWTMN